MLMNRMKGCYLRFSGHKVSTSTSIGKVCDVGAGDQVCLSSTYSRSRRNDSETAKKILFLILLSYLTTLVNNDS